MAATGTQSPSLEIGGKKSKKKKDIATIHVLCLRPTQFNVGYAQVYNSVASINDIAATKSKKKRKKKLRALNKRKKVPVIIGPGNELWMVDHHHHVRALWESDIKFSKKLVYFYILEDLSHLDSSTFWQEMKLNKWVHLLSCGETREPEHLPKDITGLLDDPYRALARAVRGRTKGWKKSRIPFTEFLWADFLRGYSACFSSLLAEGQHIGDRENLAVCEFALQLCRSDAAMLLPGYIGYDRLETELDEEQSTADMGETHIN